MSTQFEQIIESFHTGTSTLEATCQALARASQADPSATRFWGQRVETELRRGRIPAPAARSMLDALEGFECDKTMWLDPSMGLTRGGVATSAPASRSAAAPANPTIITSTEQLRATLFAPAQPTQTRTTQPAPAAQAPAPKQSTILDSIPLGTVINDRYLLLAHLGAGGVGQIFDAIDLQQPEEVHVTLKVVAVNLAREPYAFDALRAAVQRSLHLEHRNIVRIYGIDQHEDRVFIVMEPLSGRWLSGIIREVRRTGMNIDSAWPIIEGVANALAHAHQHGVVHSDLSPHAVFICDDGTPKIVGFGLAHAVPASNESFDVLDTLTLRAYTEAYTADAWAQQGEPDPADDLYPLGVMAYEMLTGMHPFERCSLSVARQKGLSYPPIVGLRRRARVLLERCLSFERKRRPKDGRTFLKRMRPGWFERLWSVSRAGA